MGHFFHPRKGEESSNSACPILGNFLSILLEVLKAKTPPGCLGVPVSKGAGTLPSDTSGRRILEKIRTEAVNPFMNLVGHVQSG